MIISKNPHTKIKDLLRGKPRTKAILVRGKQSGFALPLTILIVAVLIVAGGTGYYFYKTSQEQKKAEVAKPEQVIDETANWEVYRSEEFGFEVKYPEDWYFTANPFKTTSIHGPFVISSYEVPLAYHGIPLGDIVIKIYVQDDISYQNPEEWFTGTAVEVIEISETREILLGDRKATRVKTTTLPGYPGAGGVSGEIRVINNDTGYQISYRPYDDKLDAELLDTFEKILSTFKFIEK